MTGEKIDFTKDSEYIRLYGHPKSVHIEILEKEVEHLKTLLREHATGHIHTTIGVLETRIKEERDKLNLENATNNWGHFFFGGG